MSYDPDTPEKQEKFQDCTMDIYSIRLTSWHARIARRIGLGNLSRGIRLIIEWWAKLKGWD
jgi:hypothetical protein